MSHKQRGTEMLDLGNEPQGSAFVPLSPMKPPTSEVPTAAIPGKQDEAINLASLFTAEEQANIVQTICSDYDRDVSDRQPRMRKCRAFQAMYASVMKAKSFPFKNAANINLPLLIYPMLQVQGRIFDMLWPSNGKVLLVSPTNLSDVEAANTAETFANAYIRQKMPEMAQGLDDTTHQGCLYGSAFRRTYWDAFQGRARSDWIPIEDFVVAHSQRSQDPSMRDVPRMTMVQRMTFYELKMYGRDGIFANTADLQPVKPKDRKESAMKEMVEKVEGVDPTNDSTTEDLPRQVLEQHRMWQMPDEPHVHPAFDGQPHHVMVTIDNADQKLLRFIVREEPDPEDLQRFQRETQARAEYVANFQMFQKIQAVPPQFMPPGATMPPPPPLPAGLKVDPGTGVPHAPRPQRVRSIAFFTHYRAFPSEGFYGLGFGDFLYGLNVGANALINQHIDGVTLKNAKPGIISAQAKGQRGAIEFTPGLLVEVDAPTGTIRDSIVWMDPPPNDPTTMPLVQLLTQTADKLVASSDLMSGQTSGANRTAKETQILAEQMMMQITVLAGRFKGAFRHELDKIWRCFGVFLPEDEMVALVGDTGDPLQLRISRSMFQPSAHIMPAADPRTKVQRVDESMQVYTTVTQNPFLMQGPSKDALMRTVTEDVLRSLGAEKLVRLLPPAPPPGPPPPPPPPQPAPYWEEDAGFLQSKPHPTTPGDDDNQHIMGHMQFAASPAGASMTKEQKAGHEQHVRDHHAQLIRKTAQRMMPPQAPAGPPGAPPPGPPPPQQPQPGAPQ